MLDPNTASPQALEALPHLGPTLARRIAEARADGPFRSLDDVRARVRGIGPVTLARIAPHLQIAPPPESGPVFKRGRDRHCRRRASSGPPLGTGIAETASVEDSEIEGVSRRAGGEERRGGFTVNPCDERAGRGSA